MPKRIVIGVDPGDSMGVAIVMTNDVNLLTLLQAYQGPPGDALTLMELVLQRHAGTDGTVAVACERYVNMGSRHRTHQPTAQRMSGAVEALAQRFGAHFVQQGPSDAWAAAPNDVLRKLGWFQTAADTATGDANDANMAVRHALLYAMNRHATLFDALLRAHGVITIDHAR